MTILQHHKEKEFNLDTYFKVEIPDNFKTNIGYKWPDKTAMLSVLMDGQIVIGKKPFSGQRYTVKSSISNLKVVKRYN